MSKLKGKSGQGSSPLADVTLKGKISYFGGPSDASTKTAGGSEKSTASGAPTSTPGIAVYNEATLGGYWRVTAPNGKTQVIRQTDIGPAPWTGRVIDFTYSALGLFGYSEGNFPTNAVAHAVYLGKNRQGAIEKGGNAVEAAQQETSGGAVGQSVGNGKTKDASFGGSLATGADALEILKDLLTGNVGDLGGKLALASLQLTKDFAVGFADLVLAPGWHWNQRAATYYGAYVLDPRKVGDGSDTQYAFAWTAAFWGVGYVLLFTEPGSGNLKPAPVHRSRVARHVQRLQALPARRSLVKPNQVKEKTPDKPKPQISRATITQTGTMGTTRPRQVKVHGSRATSGVPIEATGETVKTPLQKRIERSHAKPDKNDRGRQGASSNKRVPAPNATAARSRAGHRARHR